jgi:hypothetical protein
MLKKILQEEGYTDRSGLTRWFTVRACRKARLRLRRVTLMKSIRGSRIVVVADSDHGHVLAARLRRMEVAM